MAKYIDVENYCENICRCARDYCDKNKCPIHTAPAADVAEAKHGRWIYDTEDGVYICNICDNAEYITSHYCRYCGAKMDGRGNNDG